MKRIRLTQNKYAIVDDDLFDSLSTKKWSAGRHKSIFYAIRSEKGKNLSMHRVIMGLKMGDKRLVDHIDGNGLNNQINNLRYCNHSQNLYNGRKTNNIKSSKYKGVTKKTLKNRTPYWLVRISVGGKDKYVGVSGDEETAAGMYNDAAKLYHKEFALLNVLSECKEVVKKYI